MKKEKKIRLEVAVIKFRGFLEDNKIFLDIVIAIVGIVIAYQTLKIYNLQTQISLNQNMPNIQIYKSEEYNNGTEQIAIINYGHSVKEFNSRIATFYEIEYLSKDMKRVVKEIPVSTKYSRYDTGAIEGEMSFLTSWKSANILSELNDEAYRYYEDKIGYFNVLEVNYVKVEYKDINNKIHEEYYRLRSNSPSQINNNKGEEVFKIHDKSAENNFQIDFYNQSFEGIKNMIDDELD